MLTLEPFRLQFTIPVKAKPKQSTRIATSWSKGRKRLWTHRDPGIAQYESIVSQAAKQSMKEAGYKKPTGGPVRVLAKFFRRIPKNRVRTLSEGDYVVQRPDLDNLLKGLLDGLRPLWTDDCLVVEIESYKLWDKVERIEVCVEGL